MGDLPSFERDSRGIKRSRPETLNEQSGTSLTKKARLEDQQGSLYCKVRTIVGGIWSWFAGTPTSVRSSNMTDSNDEVTIVAESKAIQVEALEASKPSILDQVVETDEIEVVRVHKHHSSASFLTNTSALSRFYGGAYNIATKEKREQDRRLRQSGSITRQIRNRDPITPRPVQASWRMGNSPNRIHKGTDSKKFVQRIRRQPNSDWKSIAAAYQKDDLDKYRKICEMQQIFPGPIIARLTGSLSRGSTPQKGLNVITKSPFSIRKTGAITKTQYLSSSGTAENPSSPVVITLYDEEEQKDEEVVIVSSTEKEPDPDVQEIVEKYSSSIGKLSDVAQTPSTSKSLASKLFDQKVYSDEFLSELLYKYDVRYQVIDQKLRSETVKRDYALEKAKRLQETAAERSLKRLSLTDVIQLEDKEEEEEDDLAPITEEMEREISSAFRKSEGTIIEAYDYPITRRDLQTLDGLNWLNDSIINFYLQMIVKRSSTTLRYPKVYAFNTYFYPKIKQSGHASVKRWTRKVDIFSFDILIVPIHLDIHWCLATIDLRKKHISYYDSMRTSNFQSLQISQCLNALEAYIRDEHQEKKGFPLETTGFAKTNVQGIPQQGNSSDCGMFACKFSEYISRDAKFTFSQDDMPYFRKRMKYEIITNTLLHP